MIRLGLGLAMLASVTPAIAAPPGSAPTFLQLEQSFARSGTADEARRMILDTIPRGTALDTAFSRLTEAGARCHARGPEPTGGRCLIHQYSLADGAADDIRWTVRLHAADGRVTTLTVDRYVDRHGSN